MIIFKKIRWMNLLSTGNIWTEIDLTKTKTSLIVGDNGSGKSTLIDAISFCLFNKTFRKINKPQLVNSITGKNCVVECEFRLGQTEYKIVRGIKPAIFEIYQDEQLINQDAAARDYQDIVEKHILKISHKSFCQVVILGSSTYVPFMQLTSIDRRNIIEDLLDLQIFTVMNGVLKKKSDENDNDIHAIDIERRLLEDKIKLVKEHIESINADKQAIIDQKTQSLESNYRVFNQCEVEASIIQDELNTIDEKLTGMTATYENLRDLEKLETQIEHKLATAHKSLQFFEENVDCPTCSQIIDPDYKIKIIEKKKTIIISFEQGITIIATKKTALLEQIEVYKSLIDTSNGLRISWSQLDTQMKQLLAWRAEIEAEIEQIKKKQQETTSERIEQYQSELQQLEERYNTLMKQRRIYDVLQYVLKDGGIKGKIIKQYVPVINKFINKYLSSMDFFVDFSLDENFDETIKSRFRDDFSYESFSEGEKFRINIAVLFAWRAIAKLRNSINTNLLIMDEVMDSSLDSNGTEEFLKILLQLTSDTNTFIISHKTDILYDKFERVLEFKKQKNFSAVEEK